MLRVCALTDIPLGKARGVVVGHAQLLLVRTEPRLVHAYLNRCPHLGIPLAWQESQILDRDGRYIQCSSHGALFELDTGFCIEGPCMGDQLWEVSCTIEEDGVHIDESELPSAPYVYR